MIQNDDGLISKESTDSKKKEISEGQNEFTPTKNEDGDGDPKKLDTSSLSIIDFSKDYKDFEGKNKIKVFNW